MPIAWAGWRDSLTPLSGRFDAMNKYLALLTVFLMLSLSLAGCGESGPLEEEAAADAGGGEQAAEEEGGEAEPGRMQVAFTPTLDSEAAPTTLQLDASDSADDDGQALLTYSWTLTDNNGETVREGSGRVTSMSLLEPGDYVVTLTVIDSEGRQGVGSKSVTVRGPSSGAREGLDVRFTKVPSANTTAPATIDLDASSTTSSSGSIVDYDWTITDEAGNQIQTLAGYKTAVALLAAGNYRVTLTVTDADGNQGVASQTVVVGDSSTGQPGAIDVNFSVDPQSGIAPQTVDLDASQGVLVDTGADVASYTWVATDSEGNPVGQATGLRSSLALLDSGGYTITLTVVDDEGNQGQGSKTVVLSEDSVARGEIDVGFEMVGPNGVVGGNDPIQAPATIDLDSDVSVAIGAELVSYSWTATCSGEPNTLLTSEGVSTSMAFLSAGQCTVTLNVTDADGNQGVASQNLTLTGSGTTAPVADFAVTPIEVNSNASSLYRLQLDASASTAQGSASLTEYTWRIFDESGNEVGLAPATGNPLDLRGETVTVDIGTQGLYVVELVVTDSNGVQARIQQSVSLRPNEAVVPLDARFEAELTSTNNTAPTTLELSWPASGAPAATANLEVVDFQWTLTGPAGNSFDNSGPATTMGVTEAGSYTIELRLVDEYGREETASEAFEAL